MNIYIDCGFYRGNTLKRYIDNGTIDSTWTVYAFDPNPDLHTEERLADFPVPVTLVKKAVWIEDGEVTFDISTSGRDDTASITGMGPHVSPKRITVPSIDFSKFVAGLPPSNIICSMDIEGAEFKVLEKMIAGGCIDRLSLLDIEFHHRLLEDYTQQDSRNFIDTLWNHHVPVILKVPLN